jgi:hypothetical protein
MKTRTLLLLAVATALAILLAGGVLLFQLSTQQTAIATAAIGETASVGDLALAVHGASEAGGGLFGVDVTMGGVDDPAGLGSMRLVTGDRSLAPLVAPATGRCTAITVAEQSCRIDFDTSSSSTSSRVLVVRRGDQQVNWQLSGT